MTSTPREPLEEALEEASDRKIRYHVRQALQHLECQDAEPIPSG